MVAETRASVGTSLKSLTEGFVLTKLTERRSPRTLEYYGDNLKRFLWFADKQGWPDDVRLLDKWQIRAFLGYVGTETCRWGLEGNGSETCRRRCSQSTVRHYYVVLSTFFTWAIREGLVQQNPMAGIKVPKPKDKVITPYTKDEIGRMLKVCDYDYGHGARFLGARNRALVYIFTDTGVRLEEFVRMRLDDVDEKTGHAKILGKGTSNG